MDRDFRSRQGIPDDSFIFLTVGSMTGVKGHREVLEAFAKLQSGGRNVTLILNGNPPPAPVVVRTTAAQGAGAPSSAGDAMQGLATGRLRAAATYLNRRVRRVAGLSWRFWGVVRREGYQGVRSRVHALAARKIQAAGHSGLLPRRMRKTMDPIHFWAERAARQPHKQVLKVDLPRPELVQAFKNADLFVFASNIEYSPLVLFETAAAGTPFLSVPVGNADEIARWTGGGEICQAPKDERGYTRVDPEVLAGEMKRMMADPARLAGLGEMAHARWQEQFTWARIAERYEAILQGDMSPEATESGGEPDAMRA
ncbi:glycosyltransferase family 4 protein [Cupriavidus basilensis]